MDNERDNLLLEIKKEILNLKSSPLYLERTKNKVFPVIGQGNHFAKIMFIGEAPGKNEAATGRPFCGQAGKVLDKLLASADLKREDVYITNIVKDRPPSNRDPLPEEIAIYAPFLDRQINIIQPKVLAALGRFSGAYLMKKFGLENKIAPMGQIHGRVFEAQADYGPVKIITLYHPAAALYNGGMMETLKKDFQILKKN